MNDSIVKQRVMAFHANHGAECSNDGAWHYYPDGAKRDVDPLGALVEPPDPATPQGEWDRAQNKLMFWKCKLNAAVNQFDDLNTRLAHTIPADPDAELAVLKKLQALIGDLKEQVTQAETALANTRRGKTREEMRRRRDEEMRRFNEFQEARRTIRV